MATAREAGRRFVGAIGGSLACVTRSHLLVDLSDFPIETPIEARLRSPSTVRLSDARGGSLSVTVRTSFTIRLRTTSGTSIEPYISHDAYSYRLLDRLERELLVYHWQPGPSYAGPDHPHLHVSAVLRAMTSAVDQREIDLDKLHLPTGHVTLASVVRSLVTELGVEPARADWARVLDEAEAGEVAAVRAND